MFSRDTCPGDLKQEFVTSKRLIDLAVVIIIYSPQRNLAKPLHSEQNTEPCLILKVNAAAKAAEVLKTFGRNVLDYESSLFEAE